jgi:hypothetical protein
MFARVVNSIGRASSCMGIKSRWHTATGSCVGTGCWGVAAQPGAGCTFVPVNQLCDRWGALRSVCVRLSHLSCYLLTHIALSVVTNLGWCLVLFLVCIPGISFVEQHCFAGLFVCMLRGRVLPVSCSG